MKCKECLTYMKCKECLYCTWACPGWMCMNRNHPQYKEDSDEPLIIQLDDCCELFTNGENDYKRFLKEEVI